MSTVFVLDDDGGTGTPLICGTCAARTGFRLAADCDLATATCPAGHIQADSRLTPAGIRAVVDEDRATLLGDLDVPLDGAEKPSHNS
ncbi:hypothetical protein ACH4E8_14845 [Streptomyces sp. NPDC017979]|uniref:hypothetical protein n=1 Tax=Streptomyces sp. NPDC017979 TaxID=3365024 RepID=UPI003787531F